MYTNSTAYEREYLAFFTCENYSSLVEETRKLRPFKKDGVLDDNIVKYISVPNKLAMTVLMWMSL